MFPDDLELEPAIDLFQKLCWLAKLCESMDLSRQLIYYGDKEEGDIIMNQEQTFLDVMAKIKRRARSATILWDVYLRYYRADEIQEVCIELC